MVFLPAKKRGEGAESWTPDSMPSISKTEKDDPLRFASAVGFGATLGGQGPKIKGAFVD